MKPYEREFFIARIACGYLTYTSQGGYNLQIRTPTIQQSYESGNIYSEAYNQAILDGVLTEEDVSEMMAENGLWTEESEKILKGVFSDIEKLKKGVFRTAISKTKQDIVRKNLRVVEKTAEKLFRKKNAYSSVTCEGYAYSKQLTWLIENTTYYLDGSSYDWKDDEVEDVVRFYQEEQLSDSDIRAIAKSDEWKTIWSASKLEGGIFGKLGVELSKNQKTLISFSRMYDNIYESMECPSDDVISDDDAIDGWFIIQREKRDKQQKEAGLESMLSDKTKNADEIMLMTNRKDKENIESIYSMNDAQGKMVTKSRFKQVEEQGEVKYQDFGDMRRERQMQQTRAYSDKFKGNK